MISNNLPLYCMLVNMPIKYVKISMISVNFHVSNYVQG